MKIKMLSKLIKAVVLLAIFFTSSIAMAQQSSKDQKIIADAKAAKSEFIQADASLKNSFDNAYAYVIFTNVGKGAVGVGGAAGNGAVFQKNGLIGMSKMTQVTVGLQLGGQ